MFKVGDNVEWSSGAQGYAKVKKGMIIRVVPGDFAPLPRHFPQYTTMFDGDGRPRGHESYLVEVAPKGKATKNPAKPKLYWPRVSQLRKA